MGWSGGSRLFGSLITTLMENVPEDAAREAIYRDMVDAFQDADWDTLDECLGDDEVYDAIYEELFPNVDTGEDDDG